MVNSVKFHTRDLNNRRVTQNNGVCIEWHHEDTMHDFYSHVCKIWELEYMFHHKVVLFQCEWYNTGTNDRRRMIRTDAHCTSIDVTSRWYQNDHLYFLVKRNKFSTFKISNCVALEKLCNASNIGECLMSGSWGRRIQW